MGCIYKVTNRINGKVYIGQTIRAAETRWNQHKRDSLYEYKDSYNCHFHRAIRKYGADAFTLDVVEVYVDELLNDREIFWISQYDSFNSAHGYNNTSGGNAPTSVSDETRKKIALAESGENNHYYGKHLSEEHRKKIGDAQRGRLGNMYGKHHTAEQIASIKIAEAMQIVAYTDSGDYLYFMSTMAAMRCFGFDAGHISQCIKGKRKTAYTTADGSRLKWRKASDEESEYIIAHFLDTGVEYLTIEEYTELKEDCVYARRVS